MKHRTQKELLQLQQKITACIHREDQAKCFGARTGASQTYAYSIATRLGFASMLVSAEERQHLRERRGVAHLFIKPAKKAA